MKDRFYDNTRLQAYRSCERMYYFRHVRDWTADNTKAALVFGGAWHASMDVVWRAYGGVGNAYVDSQLVIGDAMRAFDAHWTSYGFPGLEEWMNLSIEEQKQMLPRTPMVAAEMLYGYIEAREDFMRHKVKLLSIEEPFAVPLDPNDPHLWYVGRLDKVVRLRASGDIKAIEHKTTSSYRKDGHFQASWIESFDPNSQVEGYIYAGKMKYGDKFKGVLIDGALVHRDVHDGFRFIPVERQMPMLEAWLWNTHRRIRAIEADLADLQVVQDDAGDFLRAFPQKTEACTIYNGTCPYLDLCKSAANPERWVEPPKGWKEEKWEPFDLLKLAEIGFTKE